MRFFTALGTAVAVSAFALAAVPAHADFYTFTITTATDSGSGTLTTSGNSLIATAGSLTVNGGGVLPAGVFPLFPNPNAPNTSFSPSGAFFYDNLVNDDVDPALTNGGLLFVGSGFEFNIYSNGPGNNYGFQASSPATGLIGSAGGGTFTLTEVVPEPGVVAFGILASGSVLGLIARKRKA